ncbi:NADPH-dependent FMN reductase [Ottowia sp.]|uniref:NADPH-dependent FMN reductase n=1 Tax=Ottowia sp. TaxID=1898956 RepID=UPI003A838EF3
MTRILIVSGSLRAGSFNTALARTAQQLAPGGVQVDVATLHGIALYDGDTEAREGIPAAVLALKERVLAADGLLLATPEYNNGVPGVLKNGIDWLSRADLKAVFGGRPVGLMGASPSGFGTLLSQAAWLATLKSLGAQVYSGSALMVSRAHTVFDAQGQLTDERTRQLLTDFVADFAAFVQQQRR